MKTHTATTVGRSCASDRHDAETAFQAVAASLTAPGIQWAFGSPGETRTVMYSGLADTCTARPVGPGTVFLSASTSKVITAILVLQMIDRGLISLDTSLSSILPEIPYGAQITVRMALGHTAGLPNPNPMRWVHCPPDASFDEARSLNTVMTRSPRLLFEPGTRYRYSNVGYWLLGRLLERLSGQTYAQLVEGSIAARLGLDPDALGVKFPDDGNGARGHVRTFSLIYAFLRLAMPEQLDSCCAGTWARRAKLEMNGPAYGGIFATCSGYVTVLQDVMRGESCLLSSRAQETFLSRDPKGLSVVGMRVGTLVGQPYLSKPGGGPGYSSNLRIYPEMGLVSVWMRNALCFSEQQIEALSDRLDSAIIPANRRQ